MQVFSKLPIHSRKGSIWGWIGFIIFNEFITILMFFNPLGRFGIINFNFRWKSLLKNEIHVGYNFQVQELHLLSVPVRTDNLVFPLRVFFWCSFPFSFVLFLFLTSSTRICLGLALGLSFIPCIFNRCKFILWDGKYLLGGALWGLDPLGLASGQFIVISYLFGAGNCLVTFSKSRR